MQHDTELRTLPALQAIQRLGKKGGKSGVLVNDGARELGARALQVRPPHLMTHACVRQMRKRHLAHRAERQTGTRLAAHGLAAPQLRDALVRGAVPQHGNAARPALQRAVLKRQCELRPL
jgi:hypothetical protein